MICARRIFFGMTSCTTPLAYLDIDASQAYRGDDGALVDTDRYPLSEHIGAQARRSQLISQTRERMPTSEADNRIPVKDVADATCYTGKASDKSESMSIGTRTNSNQQ